ncbi:uncharacterized protein E0L32_009715 [Thyridium curvatum]|uniref:Exonuclease domain-containing protein n=1 Tax=Thyridium curvatum TaxID=1093900 RepID=A0A507AGD0_9PEZI|nr:uncharacterized protein E0L32_009715 [Thyridium curvatum]TPX08775.1 hypothetical protein E0L32_009715 [Thyridium curvatum]
MDAQAEGAAGEAQGDESRSGSTSKTTSTSSAESASQVLSDSNSVAGVKRPSGHDGAGDAEDDDDGWQTIRNGRPTKKLKKVPKKDSNNYPTIQFSSSCRLQNKIQVSDLRHLVLYLFADGAAPHWVAVSHRPNFRKIVVVLVPGLEEAMFKKHVDFSKYSEAAGTCKFGQATNQVLSSPDDYYPRKLKKDELAEPLQPFADMFEYMWPVRATGNERVGNMHSPITTFLTAPNTKSKEEKDKNKKGPRYVDSNQFKDVRTRITEFVTTPQIYLQNNFLLHPAMLPDEEARKAFKDQEGWVHTNVEKLEDGTIPESEVEQGSITAGHDVYAIDCEMCKTGESEFSLTRISIVKWDGEVIMDELVKPDKPIIDYLTPYSGITKEMLDPVTTTLHDIQQRLLKLFDARSILVGHSLDSDLSAMKLTHPFIVDSSIIFPHPAGPEKKHGLKWLAQKFLNREVQKGHGTARGHDSVEDARTCLDLVKKKCEKGKLWATGESDGENLFKRLGRAGTSYRSQAGPTATGGLATGKTTAAVDWGNPRGTMCGEAAHVIACRSDADVEAGVVRAVRGDPDGAEIRGGGVDFVWARLRELEAQQGWWNRNRTTADDPNGPPAPLAPSGGEDGGGRRPGLEVCVGATAARLRRIYDALPPCTAFVVFSGSGDPREMSGLQARRAQHKREYHTPGVKWSEISVKWDDEEEQALKRAVRKAREGIGFIAVK